MLSNGNVNTGHVNSTDQTLAVQTPAVDFVLMNQTVSLLINDDYYYLKSIIRLETSCKLERWILLQYAHMLKNAYLRINPMTNLSHDQRTIYTMKCALKLIVEVYLTCWLVW